MNILFCTTAFFLALSLPFSPHSPAQNIFVLTKSRLDTPVDLLFSRLAKLRPAEALTPADDLLREKLVTIVGRKLYLRFGEDALVNCPFCAADNPMTYLLYYLPFNIFLPHLFHLLILGLVTSASVAGTRASRWRNKFVIAELFLIVLEITLVYTYDPTLHGPVARNPLATPQSLHNKLFSAKLVVFAIFDAMCAGLIYLSATNRLFYPAVTPAEQAGQMVSAVTGSVAGAASKLHALNVAKNAIVRDEKLKAHDGKYWSALRDMEASSDVWQDEEVVRAVNRAMQNRQQQMEISVSDGSKRSADPAAFVDALTAGLEVEK